MISGWQKTDGGTIVMQIKSIGIDLVLVQPEMEKQRFALV